MPVANTDQCLAVTGLYVHVIVVAVFVCVSEWGTDFYQVAYFYIIAGDFRMFLGEDKNKVSNIVKPNVAAFKLLYESSLNEIGIFPENGVINKVCS